MRIARVSPLYARQHDLNPNHHARVWCLCMNDPGVVPGQTSSQPLDVVLASPGHFVQFDHIAVIDLRVAGSALAAFRAHVEETNRVSA